MIEKLKKHLEALQARLDVLNAKIADEEKRPLPDDLGIQSYKKHKLLLEEEIEEVNRKLAAL